MVNSKRTASESAFDFGLERGDARVEFVDREALDILPRQKDDRVVGAKRLIVGIHGPKCVGPLAPSQVAAARGGQGPPDAPDMGYRTMRTKGQPRR